MKHFHDDTIKNFWILYDDLNCQMIAACENCADPSVFDDAIKAHGEGFYAVSGFYRRWSEVELKTGDILALPQRVMVPIEKPLYETHYTGGVDVDWI